jgi:acyl-CoA reductase-like NAD-dependent aldehyde dehydrogenase
MYGLGAGLWTRDAHEIYQVPRAIQAGRVWVISIMLIQQERHLVDTSSRVDEKITK